MKLIKVDDIYTLMDGDKMIASSDSDFQTDYEVMKLSKQNCDEIFGVTDVEKLAEEYGSKFAHSYDPEDFIAGFNKAMDLMKDKLFTLSNLRKAFNSLENHPNRTFTELVALLKPTEIEVIIEMECDGVQTGLCSEDCNCNVFPKLDSEGCLILKKI